MRSLRRDDDPYRILGIVPAADIEMIKAAHRRLAKRFHPDASGEDGQRFLAIQEAYQLLMDPVRRREWDRRHAPGPVRAARSTQGATGGGDPARTATRARPRNAPSPPETGPARPTGRPRRPARDASGRTRTWSAERVPWWEDFTPKYRAGEAADDAARSNGRAPGEGPAAGRPASPDGRTADPDARDRATADRGPERPTMDFDVFNRSSGAAWSMAARRHFRGRDADLPSRGAWRYRGTQVVTGAEARKVAAEEAAAEAGAAAARRSTESRPSGSTDEVPAEDPAAE